MIAIIDYGMGNLASVRNAFLKLGYEAFTSSKAEEIVEADKVVLPGVGAFGDAVKNLHKLGLDKAIQEIVRKDTPLLGVCLGLQLLFSESQENGLHKGLDIIKGQVVRFQLPRAFKVPHMGWNQVLMDSDSILFRDIAPESYFYFVHSYYVVPEDDYCLTGISDYGMDFVCAIERKNLFGTQFHPEKSSELGLKILKNFGEI